MKKAIIATLLLLIPLVGFSQKKFGMFAGLSNSSVSEGVLQVVGISGKMGFHLGGFYEFDLTNKIKFRPKFVYSQQGNRDGQNSSISDLDNYKTNYLNFPLNFKFFDKTYILAGPQIGFLVSESRTLYTSNGETIDLGFNLGFGQKIKDLFLELNFYQGLTKAVDRSSFSGEIRNGTNTVIQLSVGYYIL